MRDTIIARRALLALAAGAVAAGWRERPAGARTVARSVAQRRLRLRHPHPHPEKLRHIVVLDPGHGGIDPGAISPHGLFEKNITLPTARELAHLLYLSGRYRPLLTRTRDVFVPLQERVAKARADRADLFLSLHADALPNTALRGLSVFTLSERASDREAADLARSENRDNFVGGMRLSHEPREIAAILFDLARRETGNRSLLFAQDIVEELGRVVPLLEKPQRSAAFAVLTAPDIPSALVELGCLSNPQEERLLPRPVYQRRLALGLMRAIDDYFASAVAV